MPTEHTAATDEMLQIEPERCSLITGNACLQVRKTLFRFTSMICCQASSVRCVGPASPPPMPTLLCSTSIRPYSLVHPRTSASQSRSCVTSASKAAAAPPSSSIIAFVSRADCRFRSTRRTLAPSRANRSAVARPLPIVSPGVCPAPTTIATLSWSLTSEPLDAVVELHAQRVQRHRDQVVLADGEDYVD